MPAASSRLIATWRWWTGTRSPATASAIGNMPPAATPVATRRREQERKIRRRRADKAAHHQHARQIVISRVLPIMSASGPSTGCSSA